MNNKGRITIHAMSSPDLPASHNKPASDAGQKTGAMNTNNQNVDELHAVSDYVQRIEEFARADGQRHRPRVEVAEIPKGYPAQAVLLDGIKRDRRIRIDPTRLVEAGADGHDHSQVLLARAVVSLHPRSPLAIAFVLLAIAAMVTVAVRVILIAPTQATLSLVDVFRQYQSVPYFCMTAIAFSVAAFWVGERSRERRTVSLVGREAVLRWLEQKHPQDWETRQRIKALGGTPRSRRAEQPLLRPRTELSWRTTVACVFVVWVILFLVPTVTAIGDLVESTVEPDDTSTPWAALTTAARLIVSSLLAVLLLVSVRTWRNLTWTQVGIPYQRWAHGKWSKSPLVSRRRFATAYAFLIFFIGSLLAGLVASVVGGIDANQNIAIDNLPVAVIQCIRAGIFEEIGFVAIPAALVLYRTQVDRPTGNKWPIVALVIGSGIARALPHIYYGPGALAWAFTWGSIVMLTFLFTRRILPVISAHIVLDLIVILVHH
ncbi:hypothetical protein ABIE52_006810 [Rhodococcus sp. OAS809]